MFLIPVCILSCSFVLGLVDFSLSFLEHIKYPESNKGAPPNPNASATNSARKSSTTTSPSSNQPAPPPPLNGARAVSPTGPQSDTEDLRRAMSPPGSRPGTRTPNGTAASAPTQSLPGLLNPGSNTKVKAPVRPRRDEDETMGTDDDHATDTIVTSESANSVSTGTRATERSPTPTEPQTQAHRAKSPTYGIASRAISPVGSVDGQQGQPATMTSVAMSINGGLGRSPSPTVDRSKPPLDAFYQSSASSTPLTSSYAHSHTHSQQKFGSTGNVTADLIRDYKAKEMEVEMLRKREAWMKTALLKASRLGFVQVDEELLEAENLKLGSSTTDEQTRIMDMILNFKHFKTQMQVNITLVFPFHINLADPECLDDASYPGERGFRPDCRRGTHEIECHTGSGLLPRQAHCIRGQLKFGRRPCRA